jgi:hypothetical protein
MATVEVICLANSWKHGGRCIAGLRTDGGGWIRPVSTGSGGILQSRHYTLARGREAALLDVLQICLLNPQPALHHPEDWLLDAGQWEQSMQFSPSTIRAFLQRNLTVGPELLGNTDGKIAYSLFQQKSAGASLALIQPEAISWLIEKSAATGRRKVRVIFALAGGLYNLPLTDPVWQKRLAALPDGCHSWKEGRRELLLTISLGEPFGREGYCYKLVAGVIALPPANWYTDIVFEMRKLWHITWDWTLGRVGRRRC